MRQRLFVIIFILLISMQVVLANFVGTSRNTIDGQFNGAFAVATGDIDGDGANDVVGAAHYDDQVSWFRNANGDGSTWVETVVGTSFDGITSVAIGDINGNGVPDIIAVAENAAEVAWFENTAGDGSAWTKHSVDAAFENPAAVTVGDIDGDGRLDIAAARTNVTTNTFIFTGEVAWWRNVDGSGLSWTKTTVQDNFTGTTSVRLGDMDGDSDLDVVSTAGVLSDVAWFENTAGNGSAWTQHIIDGNLVGANSVAVGDMDGDGDRDVVATGANILASSPIPGAVNWYENTGSATWTKRTIDPDMIAAVGVDVGDIDLDGDLDVAASAPDADDVMWFRNNGKDTAWAKYVVDGSFDGAILLTLGDLNADFRLDIIGSAGELERRDYGIVAWWPNIPEDDPTPTEPVNENFSYIGVNDFSQPILQYPNEEQYQWIQVYIGKQQTFETVHAQWYNAAERATCAGDTCQLALDTYAGFNYTSPGEYVSYIQPYNVNRGFINNDLQGWIGPQTFTATATPPPAATDLVVDQSSSPITLSWTGSAEVIAYQVWVGTLEPLNTTFTNWILTQDLGCAAGGTCTLTLDVPLGFGTYSWYVQGWGVGGMTTGGNIPGADGWAAGPEFIIGGLQEAFSFGGHVDQLTYPDQMRTAGMGWMKKQISFSQGMGLTGADAQYWIDLAAQEGFHLMFGIVGDEGQLGANPDQFIEEYAAFVGDVAARMGQIGAIEVWNEPNIDREWPNGQISGANYTTMLSATYTAIKRENPNIMVISGAPAPTGFWGGTGCAAEGCNDDVFIRDMRDAGAADYLDCVGLHYNEGVLPPSATSGDPRGSSDHYSRYFLTMIDLYSSVFPDKPLCFTEIGYLTDEGLAPLPAAFWWAADITRQNQADWLIEAVGMAKDNPVVRMLIIWNVDLTQYGADPMLGYAIVRNGDCPACAGLGEVMRQ